MYRILKAKVLHGVSQLSKVVLCHVSVVSHAPKVINVGHGVDAFFLEGPNYESRDVLTAGSGPVQAKWQTGINEIIFPVP